MFLKKLYFDLITHFLKRKDTKSVDQLVHGWQEVDTEFAELPPVDKVP